MRALEKGLLPVTTEEKPRPLYLPAAPELLEEPAIGTPDTIDRLEASVRKLKAALAESERRADNLRASHELPRLQDVAELEKAKLRADRAEARTAELGRFLEEAIKPHAPECEVKRWASKLGFGPDPECSCATVPRAQETTTVAPENFLPGTPMERAALAQAKAERDDYHRKACDIADQRDRAEARCVALAKDVDAGAVECDALRALLSALQDALRLTGEQLDVIYSAGHGADVLHAVQKAQQLVQAAAPAGAQPAPKKCPKCRGEGQVANSNGQEPWSEWASLPPGSDIAVRLGMVRPIPCPNGCKPTGGTP